MAMTQHKFKCHTLHSQQKSLHWLAYWSLAAGQGHYQVMQLGTIWLYHVYGMVISLQPVANYEKNDIAMDWYQSSVFITCDIMVDNVSGTDRLWFTWTQDTANNKRLN